MAGLLLFGLTLPLSKSAGNIILFLIYPLVFAGVWSNKDFRDAVLSNLKQPMMPAFLLYFLTALIGVSYTEKYIDGFRVSNATLSLPAIYLMASVLIQTIPDIEKRYEFAEKTLLSFLIGLTILNGIGFMTWLGFIGQKKYVLPLAPLHIHHIWFSTLNAVGIYTAAAVYLFSSRVRSMRVRLLLIAYLALAVFGVVLSTSRAAWIGILLTSIFVGMLSRRGGVVQKMKIVVITAAIVAVVYICLYMFVPVVHDRIGLIRSDIVSFSAGTGDATSLGARFLMWKAAVQMFMSNPLAGVGTGDYVPTMAAYIKSGQYPEFLLTLNQPHNMYLFALATNGLPGLAALLYIFYCALRFAVPLMQGDDRQRLFAFIIVATVVHFMIAGFFDSFFNIQMLRYTFAFIMGVCARTQIYSALRS